MATLTQTSPFSDTFVDGWTNSDSLNFRGNLSLTHAGAGTDVYVRVHIERGTLTVADASHQLPILTVGEYSEDYSVIIEGVESGNYTYGIEAWYVSLDLSTGGYFFHAEDITGTMTIDTDAAPVLSPPTGISVDVSNAGIEVSWWGLAELPEGITESNISYKIYRGSSPALRDLSFLTEIQTYSVERDLEIIETSTWIEEATTAPFTHRLQELETNSYVERRRYRYVDSSVSGDAIYYYYVVAVLRRSVTTWYTEEVSYYSDFVAINPRLRWSLYKSLSLPNITQEEWVTRLGTHLLQKFPNLDVARGSVTDDLMLFPISRMLQDIYTVAGFVSDKSSVVRLLQIDDADGDGISDPVEDSIYKQRLRAVFGFGVNVQDLIDVAFDSYVSNFGVSRKTATRSIGSVILFRSRIFSSDIEISEGTVVATSGDSPVRFEIVGDHVMRSDSVASYYNMEKGRYQITLPIRATSSGSTGNQPAYTINSIFSSSLGLSVENPQPTNSGEDYESNTALVRRVFNLLSGLDVGTRGGYKYSALSILGVESVDVQGAMDPYQVRDWDNMRWKHVGGAVDVYVQGYFPTTYTEYFTPEIEGFNTPVTLAILGTLHTLLDVSTDTVTVTPTNAGIYRQLEMLLGTDVDSHGSDLVQVGINADVLSEITDYLESRVDFTTTDRYYAVLYLPAGSMDGVGSDSVDYLTSLGSPLFLTPEDLLWGWNQTLLYLDQVSLDTFGVTVDLHDSPELWRSYWVHMDYHDVGVADVPTMVRPASVLMGNFILVELLLDAAGDSIDVAVEVDDFMATDAVYTAEISSAGTLPDAYYVMTNRNIDLTYAPVREVSSVSCEGYEMGGHLFQSDNFLAAGNTIKSPPYVSIDKLHTDTYITPTPGVEDDTMTFSFSDGLVVPIVSTAGDSIYGFVADGGVSDGVAIYTPGHHYFIEQNALGYYTIRMITEISDPIDVSTELTLTFTYTNPIAITYLVNHTVERVQTAINTRRHITADVVAKEAPRLDVGADLDVVLETEADDLSVKIQNASNISNYVGSLNIKKGLYQSDFIHETEKVSGVNYVPVPMNKLHIVDGSFTWRNYESLRFSNLLYNADGGNTIGVSLDGSNRYLYPLISEALPSPTIGAGMDVYLKGGNSIFLKIGDIPVESIHGGLFRSPWGSSVLPSHSKVLAPYFPDPTSDVFSLPDGDYDNLGAVPATYNDVLRFYLVSETWLAKWIAGYGHDGSITELCGDMLNSTPDTYRILLLVGKGITTEISAVLGDDLATLFTVPASEASVYIRDVSFGYWVWGEGDMDAYKLHSIESPLSHIYLDSLRIGYRH